MFSNTFTRALFSPFESNSGLFSPLMLLVCEDVKTPRSQTLFRQVSLTVVSINFSSVCLCCECDPSFYQLQNLIKICLKQLFNLKFFLGFY